MMKADVFYQFSPRAKEAIGNKGIIELPHANLAAVPANGDLFSIDALPDLTFIVEERRFHWKDASYLQIHLGLDLYTEADNWVRTRKHG